MSAGSESSTSQLLMDAYHDAFASPKFDEPFLTTYTIDGKSLIVQERLTRHEFLVQAQLAAYMLESLGIGTGDCHIHYFSGNNKYDLILRRPSSSARCRSRSTGTPTRRSAPSTR